MSIEAEEKSFVSTQLEEGAMTEKAIIDRKRGGKEERIHVYENKLISRVEWHIRSRYRKTLVYEI